MKSSNWRLALLASLAVAAPAWAAPSADPESTIVSELVVVAPARGPAWWKVSKGDSVVWILGLPPALTPRGMKWDRRALDRRLIGARLVLWPSDGVSGFRQDVSGPPLPRPLAEKVSSVIVQLGGRPDRIEELNLFSVMRLRERYHSRYNLTLAVDRDVNRAARRARVPIVSPPARKHYWDPAEVQPTDPEIAACLKVVIDYAETPPEHFRVAAAAWAVGDVPKMLAAAPKGWSYTCRKLWPGLWERNVTFHTDAIARELETPGKVIAVSETRYLVAEDGILQRLRAKGYTIADPAKPLSE